MRRILATAWTGAIAVSAALNVNTTAQIQDSATAIAAQLVALYPSVNPLAWWEGGAIYGGLLDYAARTKDGQFNSIITSQLAQQAGSAPPYFQPGSLATNLTNFGQARWALTAILAGEVGFPADPALPLPYLALAEAVFNQIVGRWDNYSCGGGLNTTIYQSSDPSKDTFSMGEFFQLASRLAIKTGNGTYTFWAEKIYAWATNVGLVVRQDPIWMVYNSADPVFQCTSIDKRRWSINAGELLYGSALMYNLTYTQSWTTRTNQLLNYVNASYFPNNIVSEPSCSTASCGLTERMYSALLVKFMAKAATSAPFVADHTRWTLQQNGKAMARNCAAPVDGKSLCTVAGSTGIAQQLTALNSVVSMLIGRSADEDTTSTSPSASASASASAKSTASGNRQISRLAVGILVVGLVALLM